MKRGWAADLAFLIPLSFMLVVMFIVASYSMDMIVTSPDAPAELISGAGYARDGIRAFNSVGLLFIIGLGIALITSAFFIRTAPFLFFIFFIVQVIAVFLSIVFSNTYFAIFVGTALAGEAAAYDQWMLVFKYYPAFTMILSIIFAVAMFAKTD